MRWQPSSFANPLRGRTPSIHEKLIVNETKKPAA